nr:hypothetical protein CFP56_53650 [Quercus suber]
MSINANSGKQQLGQNNDDGSGFSWAVCLMITQSLLLTCPSQVKPCFSYGRPEQRQKPGDPHSLSIWKPKHCMKACERLEQKSFAARTSVLCMNIKARAQNMCSTREVRQAEQGPRPAAPPKLPEAKSQGRVREGCLIVCLHHYTIRHCVLAVRRPRVLDLLNICPRSCNSDLSSDRHVLELL